MDLRQKSTLQIVFVFLLFSLILATSLTFTQRIYLGYSNNQEIISNMDSYSLEKQRLFKSFIEQSEQTLFSIREFPLFNKYLNDKKENKTLENMFLAYSKSQPNFMQLRYIDKDGYEKIRVDRAKENEQAYLVKKDKLQNKANRYYFDDSKTKELEKVWFSALDLNIERGKVELPYKPTLRAVLPIKNNGKFDGIIIINYFMEGFLEKFVDTSLYDMVLFDSRGYTLYHYEKEKSWGYYKDRKFNIIQEYPEYYDEIFNSSSFKADKFISRKLDIPIFNDIYTIVKLKQSFIQEEERKLSVNGFYTLMIILLLSIPLSILMVKIFSKTLFNLQTVKDLNKELKDLALRNEIALKASGIGIWEWNLKNNEIVWDNHMYEIYGLDKNQKTDLITIWDEAIGIETLKEVKESFENAIKDKKDFDTFFWIETKDKKRKFIKAMGVFEYNEKGEVLRGIGLNQDITELKNKEQDLLDTKNELDFQNKQLQMLNRELEESEHEIQIINENLEQQVKDKTKENLEQFEVIQQQSKLAAMGEMLGNIAHQWRQPLNALSAIFFNIKFKYELGKLDEETLKYFSEKSSMIIKSMDNTIDDFRNFFRPNKQKTYFNICESIKIVINIMDGSLKNNKISLDVSCDDIEIDSYKSELEQVILVILSNSKDAIKERKKSDGKIYVRVTQLDNKEIKIEIEDNGGGIDESIIDRVFEPYFTTKHQDVGTGIGLYMSKMIVEKSMNGVIKIQNKNDGALVSIVIPKDEHDTK